MAKTWKVKGMNRVVAIGILFVLVVSLLVVSRKATALHETKQDEGRVAEGPVVNILGTTHLCFPQFRPEIEGVVFLCIPAWAFQTDEEKKEKEELDT